MPGCHSAQCTLWGWENIQPDVALHKTKRCRAFSTHQAARQWSDSGGIPNHLVPLTCGGYTRRATASARKGILDYYSIGFWKGWVMGRITRLLRSIGKDVFHVGVYVVKLGLGLFVIVIVAAQLSPRFDATFSKIFGPPSRRLILETDFTTSIPKVVDHCQDDARAKRLVSLGLIAIDGACNVKLTGETINTIAKHCNDPDYIKNMDKEYCVSRGRIVADGDIVPSSDGFVGRYYIRNIITTPWAAVDPGVHQHFDNVKSFDDVKKVVDGINSHGGFTSPEFVDIKFSWVDSYDIDKIGWARNISGGYYKPLHIPYDSLR